MSETSLDPIVVIGTDSPIGLTVMRELGERGIAVHAFGKGEDALGRWSRHASRFRTIPGPLADWLPAYVAAHRIGAVMAISEHHLIELARLKARLGGARALCPDPEKLNLVLDKRRTFALAAEAGIDVPRGWHPAAGEDFAAIARSLDYPVAIKWPDPNAVSRQLAAGGIALEKVEYAADAPSLLDILDRYAPLGVWPLVQTWVAGHGLGQMLNMHDGRATLVFQHRRLREWPPSGGVSALCEAVPLAEHAAQMERSERLLRRIGWEGPAMVEYRFDPATGRYWLMEINGRFWGSMPLAYHCGAHFAWEAWRCGVEGKDAAPHQIRQRRARYVIPDAKHLLAVLRDGKLPVLRRLAFGLRFVADFLDPRMRYYVWSLRDPGPFFGDLIGIVRKRLRRRSEKPGTTRGRLPRSA
ncbi:hypothetical protein GCM10011371_29430 [Novosphingobium marinum]|uniref:ATP-grasp domain-containing protein n=1 Tax=Novosphingobium marinum TaxID=1514948 RepID=A0A7Y9Y0M3_9SPHN|nr:carboxylate--amine ligase [Novosphingobium marinum]NYH96795.1 hypothetical protein [Novosphingobium marinum]GGC40183.1 hypothetical protein GCM10011371_29430 [Novosphingobium marinum]